jgi:rhodanese-related sulfurtransferase
LNRVLAALVVTLVATTAGIVMVAGPAAARSAPGIAGTFYPDRMYRGVSMDLSRPYVWLDEHYVWLYQHKNGITRAKLLRLESGILDIRDYTSGHTRHVIAGWYGSGATQLVLQPDSNLVLYRDDNSVVWATDRFCNNAVGEGSVLALQNDGNIVVYCTSGWGEPNILRVLWASGIW